jgi:opine dehydrogenase
MKVAVIGAGNGGQAIAAYLAMRGCDVSLSDTDTTRIARLQEKGGIELTGKIEGFARISHFSTDSAQTIVDADIIMVTTTANAHKAVAKHIAPFIADNQIIVLNPGRTCGALEFKQTLTKYGCNKKYYLAEAQTLVYACRIVEDGIVNIIGIKDEVLFSALPASHTDHILNTIAPYYPCFTKAENILRTGLENIGAIFHPCVCLFNAATIERHDEFWFYRDMTEQVAKFIEKFDAERLAVGKAYGIDLLNVTDWIKFAYNDTKGNTLCERMKNNPAYHDIKAPGSIFTRQLFEDIPTGVLPIMELGKAAGIKTPLLESIVNIIENLLEMDFRTEGRTLSNLGLSGMTKEEIINYISNEV